MIRINLQAQDFTKLPAYRWLTAGQFDSQPRRLEKRLALLESAMDVQKDEKMIRLLKPLQAGLVGDRKVITLHIFQIWEFLEVVKKDPDCVTNLENNLSIESPQSKRGVYRDETTALKEEDLISQEDQKKWRRFFKGDLKTGFFSQDKEVSIAAAIAPMHWVKAPFVFCKNIAFYALASLSYMVFADPNTDEPFDIDADVSNTRRRLFVHPIEMLSRGIWELFANAQQGNELAMIEIKKRANAGDPRAVLMVEIHQK
ncbi:MAG: hypothetical protein IPJ69_13010 [Deltaproteobacteria bacterium]|nr:MAG: hypothetical protein IPJ69_13010 [Deltaproteobacteria bacterium]